MENMDALLCSLEMKWKSGNVVCSLPDCEYTGTDGVYW